MLCEMYVYSKGRLTRSIFFLSNYCYGMFQFIEILTCVVNFFQFGH